MFDSLMRNTLCLASDANHGANGENQMAYVIRPATVGTVSHGTLRNADLLNEFAWTLNSLLRRQSSRFPRKAYRKLIREAYALIRRDECDSDRGDDAVYALQDALQQFAPAYGYFGPHLGDGSDFGFWIDDPRECCFDGIVLAAGDDAPRGYRGEVLTINDHGNMSLHVVNARGARREVWSIV